MLPAKDKSSSLKLKLKVNYVKNRGHTITTVYNDIKNFCKQFQEIFFIDDKLCEEPWTKNQYDGSFFSFEMVINTKLMCCQSIFEEIEKFVKYKRYGAYDTQEKPLELVNSEPYSRITDFFKQNKQSNKSISRSLIEKMENLDLNVQIYQSDQKKNTQDEIQSGQQQINETSQEIQTMNTRIKQVEELQEPEEESKTQRNNEDSNILNKKEANIKDKLLDQKELNNSEIIDDDNNSNLKKQKQQNSHNKSLNREEKQTAGSSEASEKLDCAKDELVNKTLNETKSEILSENSTIASLSSNINVINQFNGEEKEADQVENINQNQGQNSNDTLQLNSDKICIDQNSNYQKLIENNEQKEKITGDQNEVEIQQVEQAATNKKSLSVDQNLENKNQEETQIELNKQIAQKEEKQNEPSK
ncbi:hypothetical protein ABPG74_002751 [Tetrahymena malaccensis]